MSNYSSISENYKPCAFDDAGAQQLSLDEILQILEQNGDDSQPMQVRKWLKEQGFMHIALSNTTMYAVMATQT